MLRVLEEGEFERVGGDRPIRSSVRVVVATHRNLEDQVRNGHFRQDLFHRIFVFPITLPPLRERPGDIALLTTHFAARLCEQNGWKPKTFLPAAVEALAHFNWPGNVRELRNSVERMLLLADAEVDEETVHLALPSTHSHTAPTGTLAVRTEAFERHTILDEMKRHGFNMSETARALGLERSHLYKKCTQLGIEPQSMRKSDH